MNALTNTNFNTAPAPHAEQSANRILASLPSEDYQRIAAELALRPLKAKQVIHKHGEPVTEIVFPCRSVCSITNMMEDGSVVEVATVGREGLVGIGAVLGDGSSSGEAFVQVPGDGSADGRSPARSRDMPKRLSDSSCSRWRATGCIRPKSAAVDGC